MVAIENVEARGEELVRRADAAELTCTGSVRIAEVPARGGDVRVHVFGAGKPRGRVDCDEFDGRADNWFVADGCGMV